MSHLPAFSDGEALARFRRVAPVLQRLLQLCYFQQHVHLEQLGGVLPLRAVDRLLACLI